MSEPPERESVWEQLLSVVGALGMVWWWLLTGVTTLMFVTLPCLWFGIFPKFTDALGSCFAVYFLLGAVLLGLAVVLGLAWMAADRRRKPRALPTAVPEPEAVSLLPPRTFPPAAPIARAKPRMPIWFRCLRLVRTLMFVAAGAILNLGIFLGVVSLLDVECEPAVSPEEEVEACALAGIIAEGHRSASRVQRQERRPGDPVDWNEELRQADAAVEAKRLRVERFNRVLAACDAAHGPEFRDRAIAVATARLVEMGYAWENPPSEETEIGAVRDAYHAIAPVLSDSTPPDRDGAFTAGAVGCGLLALVTFLVNLPLHVWLRKRRAAYR